MTISRYRYYVGPEGLLQALPGFPADSRPEANMVLPAAEHVSLAGRITQDRITTAGQGVRPHRLWKMGWDFLTEDEELRIQALYRMSNQSVLRLFDPRKRNSLPEDVSTGGSSSMTTTAFTKTGAGSVVWGSGGQPLEFLGLVAGRIAWTGATNGGTLYGTTERHPIMSGIFGATYRFSAWVKTTTTFRLAASPFDLLGTPMSVAQSSQFASTAGAWQRKDWLYTPASGVANANFGIIANGSGNIDTTGWMIQTDDTLRNWAFGYGCPQVTVDGAAPASYWRGDKYHGIQLILREV